MLIPHLKSARIQLDQSKKSNSLHSCDALKPKERKKNHKRAMPPSSTSSIVNAPSIPRPTPPPCPQYQATTLWNQSPLALLREETVSFRMPQLDTCFHGTVSNVSDLLSASRPSLHPQPQRNRKVERTSLRTNLQTTTTSTTTCYYYDDDYFIHLFPCNERRINSPL